MLLMSLYYVVLMLLCCCVDDIVSMLHFVVYVNVVLLMIWSLAKVLIWFSPDEASLCHCRLDVVLTLCVPS